MGAVFWANGQIYVFSVNQKWLKRGRAAAILVIYVKHKGVPAVEVKSYFYNSKILNIPLCRIEVERITGEIEESRIVAVANSIRKNGLLEPLLLRKKPNSEHFFLICGITRYLALCYLRAVSAPAIVLSLTQAEAGLVPLIRQQTGRQLNCFEQARLLYFLLQKGRFTKQELCEALNQTQTEIEQQLQLLRLTPKQQNFLLGRGFSTRFASRLCQLPAEQRHSILTKVLLENLPEAKAHQLLEPPKPAEPQKTGRVFGVFSEQLVLNSLNNLANEINKSGGKATVVTAVSENQTEYTLVLHKKVLAG